MLRPQHFYKKS